MAVLLFLTFAAWSMGSAVGSTPDEGYVLTSIWCANTPLLKGVDDPVRNAPTTATGRPIFAKGETCRRDLDRPGTVWVSTRVAEPGMCYTSSGIFSAACQKEPEMQLVSTDLLNSNLYPDIYLKFMNFLVEDDVQRGVVKIRLLNSLIAAVLVVFALIINRRKIINLSIAFLSAVVPVGISLISSVNTSSWAIVGTTVFTLSILSIDVSKLSSKHTVLAVSLSTVGLLIANASRYETKYQLFLIFVFVSLYKYPNKLRHVLTKRGMKFGAITVFFTFFLLRQFRNNQISELLADLSFEKENAIALLITNTINLPLFMTGFFGSWGLGSFDIILVQSAWLFPTAAFFITYGSSMFGSSKRNKLLSIMMIGSLLIIVLMYLQKYFVEIRDMVQPRYFFPLLIGIALTSTANRELIFSKPLVISVGLLTAITNSIALRTSIRRYVTGQNLGITESLNSPRDWWWTDKDSGTTLWAPAPETVWLIGSLAFAMLFAVIIYERKHESAETASI